MDGAPAFDHEVAYFSGSQVVKDRCHVDGFAQVTYLGQVAPGTAVPMRPRVNPAAAACRLATAGPCHPGNTTHPGMFSSRGISKGSLAFAPPGHSPHL
jgi:hypothetical protein